MDLDFSSYATEDYTVLNQILFSRPHEGIIILDSSLKVIQVNPSYCRVTGYSTGDIINQDISFFESEQHKRSFYVSIIENLVDKNPWHGLVWSRTKSGEITHDELTIERAFIPQSQKTYYVFFFYYQLTDIAHQPNYDSLTNLPNRLLFKDYLSFMIAHARRNKQIVALLLLDINRFKMINETIGFSAGDTILQHVAKELKSTLREVDAVFRLGNDEFAIILEEVSKISDAAKVAKKILTIFETPIELQGYTNEFYLSASIGISIFPQDGSHYEDLIKNSEAAMYEAKQLEQNNFKHYSPEMNVSILEHITLEHQLHKAIKNEQFEVYFQPIINLFTEKIIGAEALIRWNHPELGVVSPAEFIPIAEETGLILPIGDFVLMRGCESAAIIKDRYKIPFHISINLSARQFQQKDLSLRIQDIIRISGLDSHLLHLEITESLGMKNAEETISILNELKKQNIKISLDDFGTGYSSLNYLQRFPIDTLKIDKSFLHNTSNEEGRTIVALIISISHTLGLEVIAEGVETTDQLKLLNSLQCDKGQGYYFSKPLPFDKFELMYHESHNLEKHEENKNTEQ